jgi:hypothetical protein
VNRTYGDTTRAIEQPVQQSNFLSPEISKGVNFPAGLFVYVEEIGRGVFGAEAGTPVAVAVAEVWG